MSITYGELLGGLQGAKDAVDQRQPTTSLPHVALAAGASGGLFAGLEGISQSVRGQRPNYGRVGGWGGIGAAIGGGVVLAQRGSEKAELRRYRDNISRESEPLLRAGVSPDLSPYGYGQGRHAISPHRLPDPSGEALAGAVLGAALGGGVPAVFSEAPFRRAAAGGLAGGVLGGGLYGARAALQTRSIRSRQREEDERAWRDTEAKARLAEEEPTLGPSKTSSRQAYLAQRNTASVRRIRAHLPAR